MVVLWVLLGICGISATQVLQDHLKFIYTKHNSALNETCELCYDADCLTIDEGRCEYHRQTGDILSENTESYEAIEDKEMQDRVDDIIYGYVKEASIIYKECIPLFSEYTNCNKDNICLDCKMCRCDVHGRWNCSTTHQCRPDVVLDVDHRTLVALMQALEEYKNIKTNKREKRSTKKLPENTLNPEDVLKWLYEVDHFENEPAKNIPSTTEKRKVVKEEELITSIDNHVNDGKRHNKLNTNYNKSETASLEFADLLNSIIDTDDGHPTDTKHSETIIFQDNKSEPIDLFSDLSKYCNTETSNILETEDVGTQKVNQNDFGIDDNLIFQFIKPSRIINKRSIIKDKSNEMTVPTTNRVKEILEKDLYDNVFVPLNDLVEEKQREVDKLLKIKEKLIMYVKNSVQHNTTHKNTNNSHTERSVSIYFYQIESPLQSEDFRKHDANMLDKYLKKLKRDIREVVRDVVGIQKLSSSSTLPPEIKILMRALKYYIYKENKQIKGTNTANNAIHLRKSYDGKINKNNTEYDAVNAIIEILHNLDINMPLTDALKPISLGANKIIRRLIKQFLHKYFGFAHSRILNSSYNITNDLNSIGDKWYEMTINIGMSPLPNRLYYIKYLHLLISQDIDKMEDALQVTKLAQSRRMKPIEDIVGERIISKISSELQSIDRRVKEIVRLQTLRQSSYLRLKTTTPFVKMENKSPRKSLIQHLKKLLGKSKTEIHELLKRKVPKHKIIKQIARKTIDAVTKRKMSEYEETMKRWQNNLNIVSHRRKRSPGAFQDFIDKIKNIIPAYLRGKVRPAMKKKGNGTKTDKKHRSKGQSRKKMSTPLLMNRYTIAPLNDMTRRTTLISTSTHKNAHKSLL